jgi:dihydroorotate dehydrogenase electron transfer subunit
MSSRFLGPATVVGNSACASGFYLMRLEAPGFPREIEPGQFVHLRLTDGTWPFLRRPFSICDFFPARAEEPTRLDILYEVVGVGTGRMAEMKPGARVGLLGPQGRGYRLPPPGIAPVLVGGGVGIPPLLYLARRLVDAGHRPRDVRVQLGARTAAALCLEREFLDLGVRVEVATDDGSRGRRGFVTVLLEEAAGERDRELEVLACGPTPMLKAVAEIARRRGVRGQLSLENRMGCALGACRACVTPVREPGACDWHYETVCREGPVFDLERLVL